MPDHRAELSSLILNCSMTLLGVGCAQPPDTGESPAVASDTVSFLVTVENPASKSYHISMTLRPSRCPVQVHMPAFTPGGFVQTHAKYVFHLRAEGGKGAPIAALRTDKQTWRIQCSGDGAVRLTYGVRINDEDELRLVTNWLDEKGGFFQGTTLFLYTDSDRHKPVVLELDLPPSWKAAAPLATDTRGRFVARDYDELALSPVQLGEFVDRTLEVESHQVRLVFDRPLPLHDPEQLDSLIHNAIRGQLQFFRGAPFDDYLILFHWRPDLEYGGGVARTTSMVMNIGSEWMEDLPANLEGTLAHELFHAWNGSAMRPRSLIRPDYSDHAYTDYFWFIEGVTNYYLYRTWQQHGRLSVNRFFELIASEISALESSPGRGWLSLAEADMAYAAGGPEFIDARAGGVVAGFLLDLEIRAASNSQRSLDDFMRALFQKSSDTSYVGYARDGFVQLLSETAGQDMSAVYRQLIEDVEPLDYAAWLARLGLSVVGESTTDGAVRYRVDRASALTPDASRLLDAFFQSDP